MTKLTKLLVLLGTFLIVIGLLIACDTLPDLPTRTPEAETAAVTVAPEPAEVAAEPMEAAEEAAPEPEAIAEETVEEPVVQPIAAPVSNLGAAAKAVDLIGTCVEAGVPETAAFDYIGMDGNIYPATFEVDILPLFTAKDIWFEGSRACDGCHFANSEASNHEMDLGTYEGILAGADVLEEPPGVSILGESGAGAGDYDWDSSKLHARLRNNRMPPGWEFDITEENRDGPLILAGRKR
jgi:hypothetical protein